MDPDDKPNKLRRKRNRNSEAPSSRIDNSLSNLTTKFITLIQEREHQSIDSKEAATILNVPIRRIYDITNVLEGIGMVQKVQKNIIQWVGTSVETDIPEANPEELLVIEERKLDFWINQIENSLMQLTKDPEYQELSYISYSDLRNSLPIGHPSQPLIAVHLPSQSPLESTPPLVRQDEDGSVVLEFSTNRGDLSLNVVDKINNQQVNTDNV